MSLCSRHHAYDPHCYLCNKQPEDLFGKDSWNNALKRAEASGTSTCSNCEFVYYNTTNCCPVCGSKDKEAIKMIEVNTDNKPNKISIVIKTGKNSALGESTYFAAWSRRYEDRIMFAVGGPDVFTIYDVAANDVAIVKTNLSKEESDNLENHGA